MPDSTSLSDTLKDVDVDAEAAAFYVQAKNDIQRTVSLPTDGQI